MIDVKESDADCRVTLEMDAIGVCPFDDVVDEYDIVIEYIPNGRIVEMRSLSEWIGAYSEREISHEQLCHEIHTELDDRLNPESLRVEATPQEYHGIQATVVAESC